MKLICVLCEKPIKPYQPMHLMAAFVPWRESSIANTGARTKQAEVAVHYACNVTTIAAEVAAMLKGDLDIPVITARGSSRGSLSSRLEQLVADLLGHGE